MKYIVNDGCIGCGLCEGTCPKVFSMTESGVAKAIEGEIPEDCEADAAEAMNGCPASAIEEA